MRVFDSQSTLFLSFLELCLPEQTPCEKLNDHDIKNKIQIKLLPL